MKGIFTAIFALGISLFVVFALLAPPVEVVQTSAITGSPATADYTERDWQSSCEFAAMGAKWGDPRDEAVCAFRRSKRSAARDKANRESSQRDEERARREPLYHNR